uniref:TauD/TfdA-like domain-containing protein n=1 Tax=Chromera velia CCMP2878 TaxID=1169474 RepID=A0A0G4H5W9_9ALVE|eukprot:Cvel_24817.t1-p1 / transcript=Cvel_24817.t1 / gene=Cvel_24817 / organism=Chromera_velia_CCMP2878 / gene_product=hypothetical protein / transcript_product=hypothetical protein / location=Cvel_scaffold2734:17757-20414(-) / protein_length=543 / sequence_SO=supercontig / SO=protein_coding / is_pseudo=false
MLKSQSLTVSCLFLVFCCCRAASGGIEYLPFAYTGPVLHNVTREGSLSAALYEEVGTSGLSDEVKQALERLRGGESSVVVLRGPGRLEGVPPTPLSVRASWEHIGPPALFSSVASIAHYLGNPLAFSILEKNVTFLRHIHPLESDKDAFLNDRPLNIHTDFVCFPMTPQFAIYAMLRPDNEGRPEEKEGEDESAGFYVSPLDAALSSLRSSLGDERFQTVLSELMEPDWSFRSCAQRTEDPLRVALAGADPRPIVFEFPSPSPSQQGEKSEEEGGATEMEAEHASRKDGPLHFVLGVLDRQPEREGGNSGYALLKEALKENRVGMRMRAGDIVVVDNTRAAHGREGFKVPKRLDGSDRWLYRAFSNDRNRFYSYLDEMRGVPSGAFMKEGTIEVDQEALIRFLKEAQPRLQRKGRSAKPQRGPKKSEREAKRSRRKQRRGGQQRQRQHQEPEFTQKKREARERGIGQKGGTEIERGRKEGLQNSREGQDGAVGSVQEIPIDAGLDKKYSLEGEEVGSLTAKAACSVVAGKAGGCPSVVEPSTV